MAIITILGSSSGMPGGERATSGYLIEYNQTLTLFDCGSGVARNFERLGFDYGKLGRIVITHTHPDHVCELPLVIQHVHLAAHANPNAKIDPLEIFVPEEFEVPFNQMIRAMYVIPERLRVPLRISGYVPGRISEHPFPIEAIANKHLLPYGTDIQRLGLPNKLQSHSLKARIGDAVILYSGDVGSFDDVRPHLTDCRLLILETSHIDTGVVREYAEGRPELKIVLTHITQGDFAQGLGREFGSCSSVVVAEDGMRLEVL
jgi:ribonuclease BN (tRNA processing enzyme)